MRDDQKDRLDTMALKLMVGLIGQRLFSHEDRAEMRSSISATMSTIYAVEETPSAKAVATYVHLAMDEILDLMNTIEKALSENGPAG